MRESLPAVFRENDFAMRFVGALETVLDPIVATIDSLPAYVDPRLAPRDMLEVLAAWLGIELDESMDDATRRELVLQSAEATRWRGTLRGPRDGAAADVPRPAAADRGRGRRGLHARRRLGAGARRQPLHRLLRHADPG